MAKIDKFNVASFMPILRCTLIYKVADLGQRNITIYAKLHNFRNFLSQPTLSRQFNVNAKDLNEYFINLYIDEQMNQFFKISF